MASNHENTKLLMIRCETKRRERESVYYYTNLRTLRRAWEVGMHVYQKVDRLYHKSLYIIEIQIHIQLLY